MRRLAAALGSGIFLVLAPGVVAGVVPWLLTGWRSSDPPAAIAALGGLLSAVGVGVVLHAFGRFVVEGRGTPAPIAPTERLVVGGLYRHVRNPMYVAVGMTIIGQALLLGRPSLLAYAAVFWLVVATFVRGYEEPTLRARYGEEYAAYRRAVPGWWPRLRPWSPQRPRLGGRRDETTHKDQEAPMAGPLTSAHAVTKLPAQNLDRARRFYRDRLGLEPVEEREGGLRYVCGATEFHLFLSSGAASGASSQMGFEVTDIDRVVADLRSRGLEFERFEIPDFEIPGFEMEDDILLAPDNYPSKGSGERGVFFRDSEGNLLGIGQATR